MSQKSRISLGVALVLVIIIISVITYSQYKAFQLEKKRYVIVKFHSLATYKISNSLDSLECQEKIDIVMKLNKDTLIFVNKYINDQVGFKIIYTEKEDEIVCTNRQGAVIKFYRGSKKGHIILWFIVDDVVNVLSTNKECFKFELTEK